MNEYIEYAKELRVCGLDNVNRWPGCFMRKFGLSYAEAEGIAERAFEQSKRS